MICPHCGFDNLPGSEECSHCLMDLTHLDRPAAYNRIERNLIENPVSVLHPKKPVTVPPTTTVRETMQIMLARDIGALLVVDEADKLLGIFSEQPPAQIVELSGGSQRSRGQDDRFLLAPQELLHQGTDM